ncbi:hypothetical protein F7734_09825 [Scytonema sp. UIC 10036]|uniref:hypothetical protein n=1 Tax=Scytonema sp. UIC 10036 TaxID=2304196 RepID=UPI0012DAD79D|nr:hypothetical protein [Scytonema sp. UIC 10036]MUG92731.1 hypothetical protein [Scytonema sp. UIC 10036]
MQTPKFLSVSQVIAIHQDQVKSFGGTDGVRDIGLLDSAEELAAFLELHLECK